MMRGLSIRWRLTLWYGGALAAVLALFGTTTYAVMRHQLLERIDVGLAEEQAEVVAEVERAVDSQSMLGWLERRFSAHEGFDFQITDESGARVFANPRLGEHQLALPDSDAAAGQPRFETISLETLGPYRVVTRVVGGPDGPLRVQVARPLEMYEHELAELLGVLAGTGPLVLLLASWWQTPR